ncbi:MAG: DinB family protein [Chloroflexi bacterium]|nr:DinB family protein [Chloroflexota bacterium]
MTDFPTLAATAAATLSDFEATLRSITDADVHRADPDGGWTVAEVASHIHLSGLLVIAAFERLSHHDHLFIFREELGHDVIGATPHSAEEAANRIASLRLALTDCLPGLPPALLERTVEVPPFGELSMTALGPGVIAHLANHTEQARGILRKRGAIA